MPPRTVNRERYLEALTRLADSLSGTELAFLSAHYHSPEHTATATTLALAVGFAEHRVTNLLYGRLAARLESALGKVPQSHYGIGCLCVSGGKSEAGHWRLQMRPELVEALEALGLCTDCSRRSAAFTEAEFTDLPETEVRALRDSRVGQGRFRAAVISYWGGCAVTDCQAPQLLAASHIKPWCDCTNAERLDPFNGLLLSPNLHVVFDLGLITFADDGTLLVSSRAAMPILHSLGVHAGLRINRLAPQHLEYLGFHRKRVFQS